MMGKVVELDPGLQSTKKRPSKIISMPQLLSNFVGNMTNSFHGECKLQGKMTPIVGSRHIGEKGIGDFGFFTTIYECCLNHWGLRTKPDDWWYTISKTIWTEISTVLTEEVVQDLLLKKHQTFWEFGKDSSARTTLIQMDVKEDINFPYGLHQEYNHDQFFNRISNYLQSSVLKNKYYDSLGIDFSTTSSEENIVSGLVVLSSAAIQRSNYCLEMVYGIPYIDMLGTEGDWQHLKTKILSIREFLQPIEHVLKLSSWWERIEKVCDNLIDTYLEKPDRSWWSNIISITRPTTSPGSCTIKFDGWFLSDVLNDKRLETCPSLTSSLVSFPIEIKGQEKNEIAAFVSGIAGIKIDNSMEIPTVEARHGWALFVGPDSQWLYQNHRAIHAGNNGRAVKLPSSI